MVLMTTKSKQRDTAITRRIHGLFWEANFQQPWTLALTYAMRLPASALLNAVSPLVAALGVQAILDGNAQAVYHYAWLTVGIAVVYSVMSIIGSVAVNNNAANGTTYLTNKVFGNFLNKDYEFYANRFSGALGEQLMRLRSAYNDYGYLVTAFIPSNIATILVSLIIVGIYSIELAFATFMAMFIIVVVSLAVSNHRRQFRRQVSQANSLISGQVGDALAHGNTVKSFGSDDAEIQRLQAPLQEWSRVQFKAWMSGEQFNAARAMLTSFAVAALLVVSLWLYQDGKISATLVVLVQIYVIRLVLQTLMFGDMVKQYEQVISAAYDPVATLLVESTVVDSAQPKSLPKKPLAIELSDVSFHYDEAKEHSEALSTINLVVKPGKKIGLVGHSGSGKTTLTKLLLRFMDISGGSISLGGVDIREIRQRELRQAISYVPQEPLLFHRSILENIRYGRPDANDADVKKAAKLAYLDEFIDELPQGYDTLVGERGVKLSGGQRQRVAIARALLKDSPILVLDEATSALDSKSEKYIQDALWKLMKNRTAIVIAHRLSTIQHMDKIVVLDKGKIVQVGTHDELKAKPGIYADLWAHQSGGYIGTPESNENVES